MELLAHISAPTSNKQDEKYRNQAYNYIAFQTGKRLKLSDDTGPVQHHDERAVPQAADIHQDDVKTLQDRNATFIDDTQLAISGLESQIITSSLRRALEANSFLESDSYAEHENRDALCDCSPTRSKHQRAEVRHSVGHAHSDDDMTTELSVFVPGDQHQQDPAASVKAGDSFGVRPSSRDQEFPSQRVSPHKPSGSSSWTDDHLESKLPSTFSISDETSKASDQQHGNHSTTEAPHGPHAVPSAAAHTIHVHDSSHVPVEPPAAHVEPPTSSNAELHMPDHLERPNGVENSDASSRKPPSLALLAAQSKATSSLGVLPVAVEEVLGNTDATTVSEDMSTSGHLPVLSLMIRPPVPPTGMGPAPSSLVTPSLQSTIEMPDMRGRYRPKSVSRALRRDERGYWAFAAGSLLLNPIQERDLWMFLTRMIQGGNAGWGVWVARTPDVDEERLGRVRVFCWGEVVEHVWLLLYIASRSKIKKSAATWCDAGGEVIIRT